MKMIWKGVENKALKIKRIIKLNASSLDKTNNAKIKMHH